MTGVSINLADLLAPIRADQPGGEDLRADFTVASPFRSLKDQRNRLRTLERRADEGTEVEPPDWQPILDLATDLLKTRSKDFELACWATEALVRLEGFAGLAAGFELLAGLVAQHWDHAFPQPDDGPPSDRVVAIANLNGGEQGEGTLLWPINRAPVLAGRDGTTFARWQYKQAMKLEERDGEAKQRLIGEGQTSLDALQKAADAMSPEACRAAAAAIDAAAAAFAKMNAALDERCGGDAPASSNIDAALAECRQMLKSFAGAKLDGTSTAPPGIGTDDLNRGPGPATHTIYPLGDTSFPGLPVARGADREQLLATLLAVAAAMRQLEPQSVIPPLLERAVKWARLPVEQLLRELIVEDGALSAVTRLTGVKYYTPEESS